MNAELLDKIYNNDWIGQREKQLLMLKFREGLFNYQIAMEMNCSTKTVERMTKRLLRKVEPIILRYYKDDSV